MNLGSRIFVLTFLSLNSVHLVLSEPSGVNEFSEPRAWLRVCQGATILGSEPGDRCPSGFWFKKPQKIGCACGHGVWVFAKGWCDKQARVIVAYNGTCFAIDKEVRFIRSIGYSNDAFAPYHFQTTVGFEFVQSLPGAFEYTYSNIKYDQHLGAVFRVDEIESVNSYNCLDHDDPAKMPLALKYYTEKVSFQRTEECFKIARRNNSFTYDEGFNLNEYFVMKERSKQLGGLKTYLPSAAWKGDGAKCALQCLGNGAKKPGAPDANANTNATGNGTETEGSSTTEAAAAAGASEATTASTFPEGFVDPDTDYQNVTVPDFYTPCNTSMQTYNLTSKTLREIHEQTKRMILTNLASSMKRIVTPRVNIPDYLHLQMSRGVLEKVCPSEYIPHDLVIQLHRMFRVAVRESLRMYPFDQKGDEERTERITAGLQECLAGAKPFYVEQVTTPGPPGGVGADTSGSNPPLDGSSTTVDPAAPTSNTDSTTVAPAQTTHGPTVAHPPQYNGTWCPGEIDKFVYAYDEANTTLRTLFTGMPPDLVADIDKLDLVTETVWKTVMVTHYYCARHFMLNATDFSSYYDKMEMFFNRWIQHRWYAPGLSPKAYEYALSTYDLKRFAQNLDMCVSATKSISSHRKWIKRPVAVRHCGGMTFQEIEDIDKKSKNSILDAIRPQASTFNDGAFCLPHWHSPASNPGIDYDPAKDKAEGCITYIPDEWEDAATPDLFSGWTNSL